MLKEQNCCFFYCLHPHTQSGENCCYTSCGGKLGQSSLITISHCLFYCPWVLFSHKLPGFQIFFPVQQYWRYCTFLESMFRYMPYIFLESCLCICLQTLYHHDILCLDLIWANSKYMYDMSYLWNIGFQLGLPIRCCVEINLQGSILMMIFMFHSFIFIYFMFVINIISLIIWGVFKQKGFGFG